MDVTSAQVKKLKLIVRMVLLAATALIILTLPYYLWEFFEHVISYLSNVSSALTVQRCICKNPILVALTIS